MMLDWGNPAMEEPIRRTQELFAAQEYKLKLLRDLYR